TNDNGQYGAQGGAGGGALLIASSTTITLDASAGEGYGFIDARGGTGGNRGCGGAGGAVRLVANTIANKGPSVITTSELGGVACGSSPQNGVVRLEANSLSTPSEVFGTLITSLPFALNLPKAPPPVITVASIDGVAINANPFGFPDKTINTGSPVPVVIQATNLPTGATVTLY